MKRHNDVDMETGRKRLASSDDGMFTMRVLCPVEHAGTVIGKGGETIDSIRTESGASIRVEDKVPNCEERVVKINAGDCSDDKPPTLEALTMVVEKLAEADGEKTDDANFTVRLLVWSSQTGCIIGKGGETISKLRENSGADIRVLPRRDIPLCASVEDDAIVQIVGTYNCVCDAIEAIATLLRENPMEENFPARPVFRPSPNSVADVRFRMMVPSSKAGSLIGRGGQGIIQKLRDDTGSVVRINNSFESDDEYRVVIFRSSVDGPVCAAQEALLRCMYFVNEQEPGSKNSARILVPSKEVGAVIGKGGDTIRRIREGTAAFIRVIDEDELPKVAKGEKMVFIEGSPTQVGEAVRAVTACLINSPTRSPANSPSGPPGRQKDRHKNAAETESMILDIAAELVGAIIGKAGANISQIRQISEADVKLNAEADEHGNRQLEIHGTPQECQAAASIVQAFLAKAGDAESLNTSGRVIAASS